MIDLSSIIQSAQGGQAVDNLSARFGLSPAQTQSALDALLPAIQMGLQNKAEGGGLGSILGQIGGAHTAAFNDPRAAQSDATVAHGSSILGDLLGGSQNTTQVAQQAATVSGVPASVIQAMLPMIISMLMGGLMHGAQNGAFGGILSSVLGSFMGGSRGMSPQPTPGPAPEQGGGGLGGMLGGVLGGLLGGGGRQEADPVPNGPAAPASAEATLSEISDMFKAGTPAAPAHEAQLASILGRR